MNIGERIWNMTGSILDSWDSRYGRSAVSTFFGARYFHGYPTQRKKLAYNVSGV